MTTDIVDEPSTTTAIQEYSATEAGLADLRKRFEGVQFQVTVPKEMTAAREARREIVALRVDLEAKRVDLKAPVLDRGRLIDAEAKRITRALTELEDPIDQQIKAEELRRTEERARREREEEARIAGINRQLDAIRHMPLAAMGKSVSVINQELLSAQDIEVDAFPPDYREIARGLVDAAVTALTTMRDERIALDRQKRQQEEQRRQLDADEKAARDRQAEADRVAQAERDRLDNEARAAREREEAIAREAREREEEIARAERVRQDDITRAEQERNAEAQRKENEAIAEANRVESARLAEQRRLQNEKDAADRREAEERAIAEATLQTAGRAAVTYLIDIGHADHIVTRQLAAALQREEQPS